MSEQTELKTRNIKREIGSGKSVWNDGDTNDKQNAVLRLLSKQGLDFTTYEEYLQFIKNAKGAR